MDEDFDLARRPVLPLSCANEAAALRHLAALCSAQLARYSTSLEADRAALAAGVTPSGEALAYGSNRRNVLVLLRGEKEVLAHYVALAALAVPLLEAAAAGGAGAAAGGPAAAPGAHTAHVQLLASAQEARARLAANGAAPGQASGSDAQAARYLGAVVLPLMQRAEAAGRQARALAVAAAQNAQVAAAVAAGKD